MERHQSLLINTKKNIFLIREERELDYSLSFFYITRVGGYPMVVLKWVQYHPIFNLHYEWDFTFCPLMGNDFVFVMGPIDYEKVLSRYKRDKRHWYWSFKPSTIVQISRFMSKKTIKTYSHVHLGFSTFLEAQAPYIMNNDHKNKKKMRYDCQMLLWEHPSHPTYNASYHWCMHYFFCDAFGPVSKG